MIRDEHVLEFVLKSCGILVFWWIWILSFLLNQIWIGIDNILLNFFTTFGSVLELQVTLCVCNVYKPSIQKLSNITDKMPTATSCFTIQENQLAVDPMTNTFQAFETLIGTVCMPPSSIVHPHLNNRSLFLFLY